MLLRSLEQRIRRRAGALFFMLSLSGCATLPPPPAGEAVQLANVPAFAQEELQCGPAALASVLSASGVPSTPETLTADLFIPARQGSLQVELAAQARLRERVPLALQASEQALIAALREGQPPLVLLNLGVRSYPIWHYAALTGYDPVEGYTLNNGKARPQTVARGTFLRQWQWADRWALTLHKASEPPMYADAAQWIAAAAPLQRSHPLAAERAYRAAVQRWPENGLAWAALGEARFAAGDLQESVGSLRKAATLAPLDAAIANNLASVELARGCVNAARRVLAATDIAAAQPAVAVALRATQQEAEAAGADRCPD
ncbi:MAG: PA2778 family cysteine peptidase [Pseudomonadota bacterium]